MKCVSSVSLFSPGAGGAASWTAIVSGRTRDVVPAFGCGRVFRQPAAVGAPFLRGKSPRLDLQPLPVFDGWPRVF